MASGRGRHYGSWTSPGLSTAGVMQVMDTPETLYATSPDGVHIA
jgi:hypothetical protein